MHCTVCVVSDLNYVTMVSTTCTWKPHLTMVSPHALYSLFTQLTRERELSYM